MRPCHRSLKVVPRRQEATQWLRDMDRHTMQSEVGYSFSEKWKGRGRRAVRERERERVCV